MPTKNADLTLEQQKNNLIDDFAIACPELYAQIEFITNFPANTSRFAIEVSVKGDNTNG